MDHCDEKKKHRIAFKGVITALIVLIIFTLLGRLDFSFFGITVAVQFVIDGMRVVVM